MFFAKVCARACIRGESSTRDLYMRRVVLAVCDGSGETFDRGACADGMFEVCARLLFRDGRVLQCVFAQGVCYELGSP